MGEVPLCRCPDNAKVKDKMIYASSKDELKKRLVGIAVEMQVPIPPWSQH